MTSDTLIAVVSCMRDTQNGFNDAIRQTWLSPPQSSNYVFVVGRRAPDSRRKRDELILDCPDDYKSLPWKTYELCRWFMRETDYDYLFKCDTDTYVNVDKMLDSDFRDYDYVGSFNGPLGKAGVIYNACYAWASGGSGYWISRLAAKVLLQNPPEKEALCPKLKIPCEDLYVGQILGPAIEVGMLKGKHDERYGRSFSPDFKTEFTSHYCSEGMKRKFDTSWQFRQHEVNQCS